METNELIQRYSLGLCSEEDVNELERRLYLDETLQDEFLREAEIDAYLRQEAQLQVVGLARPATVSQPSTSIWKWVSGTSTLAAAVLLTLMIFNLPPQREAMAFPSLGNLTVEISKTDRNIWAAAAEGDLVSVRSRLGIDSSINAKAECGLTPLHMASLFNQSAVAELLLSNGADVSLTDHEGNTALHMAAFLGHTEVVQSLLEAGADPAVRNHLGFSCEDNVSVRWSAILEEYYRRVEKVLNVPLDLEHIKSERAKIQRLLSAASSAPAKRAPAVSLWQAAITGNTAAAEQHLAAGTDLNETEDYGGCSPLILASIFGQEEIVKLLIKAGADLEVRNNKGTALHQACFFCRSEIVRILVTAGADPKQTDSAGRTPLDIVSLEFDQGRQATYQHVYDWLNLELDLEKIKSSRTLIAEILRHDMSSKEGQQ